MNIGIVGCGAIGQKRAASLGDNVLKAVADVRIERALHLTSTYENVKIFEDWRELIDLPEIDIVIVSTTNNWLAPITRACIKAGKHVLVEKPGAMYYSELEPLVDIAKEYKVKVKIGYNLRYHPAFLKMVDIIYMYDLGEIMFVRSRYGHGGRKGYNKEWRADTRLSGGGELIDQGVHLIDLSRWLLGDFTKVSGSVHTYFWDMIVEDNAFICLENKFGNVAWLQASCTEWKNMFSFEIYFKRAKIHIEGLGGSYGVEKLTLYQMRHEMGIPDTTIWEFNEDNSFKKEIDDFVDGIKNGRDVRPNLEDGVEILKIVDKIYRDKK